MTEHCDSMLDGYYPWPRQPRSLTGLTERGRAVRMTNRIFGKWGDTLLGLRRLPIPGLGQFLGKLGNEECDQLVESRILPESLVMVPHAVFDQLMRRNHVPLVSYSFSSFRVAEFERPWLRVGAGVGR